MPDALATREQWDLAVWTSGPFSFLSLRPLISFSLEGTGLNKMGFQLADQFPGLDFYVEKRRLGIGGVPGIHFSDDFLTSLFEAVLVFHVLLCFFLGAFFSLRKDEAFTPLSCLAYALCLLAQSSPGFPHSTSFSALWPAPPCKKMTCTPSVRSDLTRRRDSRGRSFKPTQEGR